MSIPADYYRQTGETLRAACERMCRTHRITDAAIEIGYSSATALREALAARGIVIEWQRSKGFRRRTACRGALITPQQIDRYLRLLADGVRPEAAARECGRRQGSLHRAVQRHRPNAYEELRQARASVAKQDNEAPHQ